MINYHFPIFCFRLIEEAFRRFFKVFENAKTPKRLYIPFFLPPFMDIMLYTSDYQIIYYIFSSFRYTIFQLAASATSHVSSMEETDGKWPKKPPYLSGIFK